MLLTTRLPLPVSYTTHINLLLTTHYLLQADRDYTHRYEILLKNRYDPVNDVRVNADGVLEWFSEKPRLHKQAAAPPPNPTQPPPHPTLPNRKSAG